MKTAKRSGNRMIILLMAVIMAAASVMPAFAEGEELLPDEQNLPTQTTDEQIPAPQTTAEKLAAAKSYDRWVKVDGEKYYFNSKGRLIKNRWAKIKASNKSDAAVKWCWFNKKGQYKASVSTNTKSKWVKAGGKKFWFSKKKKPAGPGYHMINKKLYYMDSDRSVKRGTFVAEGEKIKTTASGSITGLPYYRYKYRNGSFVFIDISDQRLRFYRNDRLRLDCPVVTGNLKYHWYTPTGEFSVRGKTTSTYLGSYYVHYWMAFIGNEYGMHDAGWRKDKDFRNKNTYKKNGSHGCVNMRRSDAAKLYNSVSAGTPVIIQK